ncbi:pre-B-cell leukemia homeobox interacting protein 1b isoform X2 [Cololabis saira]|uniref:pre-B-cell leukemia homeobox interacting protein 1b isoform X2 n=1 Tax=Cololabis saira TaxID=129043 RepID=UPI002AD545F4|nr:pre-B-cell leukemia homeobox interacting protein 1b isoform X2 [Cololabis saira]
MSGGNSTNNSWTILTSEETVAETLKPTAAATEQHGESPTSGADGPCSGGKAQPANDTGCAEGLPVENYHKTVSVRTAEQSGGLSSDQQSSAPTAVTETPLPTSVEAPGTLVRGGDEVGQEEGLPEGPAQLSPDPNLSSDSNTLVTPSPEEPPISLLSTETLGSAEFAEAEEQHPREGTLHLQNGDELHPEKEEHDKYSADLGKHTGLHEERTEKTGEQGEPEERRRRRSLLEQIGRREDEDEEEVEEFQVPQREDDSGFSVNKCILGAVILLGLGTIFFSGIFMDLDEESDYVTRELKEAEAAGMQDWLHHETPPPQVDADNSELLNKLSKGSEQVSVLQAQLQAQKEELKVSTGQSAEEAQQRQRWDELEKENSRLKTEMASLPFLQKENDRMKRELESVPALQKELETLRSTVTELKLSSAPRAAQASEKPSTSPPTGKPGDSRQDTAGSPENQARKSWDDRREKKGPTRDKSEMTNKKYSSEMEKNVWKEGGKKEVKDAGKREWKKDKSEQGKEKTKEGGGKRHADETKQWQGKDGRKERGDRGDDGKSWKVKESKNNLKQKSEKKEIKEEKDKKKGKHEKMKEHQQRGKEDKKNWQKGKDQGERHQGREEWKGEKEWKKGRDVQKEGGKEKWDRKGLKAKGDVKDWKNNNEWKHKNDKDRGKEGKGKGERKNWEDGTHGKERMENGNGERKQWKSYDSKSKNEKQDKDWKRKEDKWDPWKKEEEDWKKGERKEKSHNSDRKKDKSHAQKNKDEHKLGGHQDHLYGDRHPPHTHHRLSMDQPEYWLRQRERLRRDPGPLRPCNSLDTCAQAERLLTVSLPEFDAILQTYLSKAAEAGVDVSKREELKKLAAEFFHDGVFVHDKMSFHDFVEDVEDILEDMVEGDDEEEEDSDLEDEMEEFEKEVMKKFSMPGAKGKEERVKGEWRKESGAGRG